MSAATVIQRTYRTFGSVPELVPAGLLVVTSVCFALASSAFLSADNISNMWAFIPELGIMALAMTMLLTAGEFDLSVGAVFAFSPLLTFLLANQHGVPIPLAIIVGVVVGAAVGAVNGLLVTKVGISSFLVTLGSMLTIRGLSLYLSNGFPEDTTSVTGAVKTLLVGDIRVGQFLLHASLFWFLLLAVILHVALNVTRFGNAVMATGGNKRSAAARGIKTDWVKIRLFMLASVLAALAGLISSVRIASAGPIAGQGYELQVIAMAVVGGTSLFGGRGTIIGTVIGAVLLMSIRNGIIIVGFAGLAFDLFVGLIILIAMSIQAILHRQGAR